MTMPTELFRRLDLDRLYLPACEAFLQLADNCRSRGVDYFAISGYRSLTEQAALYFQGRLQPGKIVTYARPGLSWHNYGLAVDFCRDKDVERRGLQPSWEKDDYAVLGEEAAKIPGLEWAGNWAKHFRELPHVQFRVRGATLQDSMRIYEDGNQSLPAVWAQYDELRSAQ